MKKKETIRDELAEVLADKLNNQFKDGKVAYFLDGATESPSSIKDWVSTGSSMLDLVISNRADGGLPVGRITEVTGLEASGKSLLAAHTLANTQKKGGVAVYIDTESAVSHDFLEAIGVDLEKMLYVPLDTIEDIFSAIEHIIDTIRSSDKDRLVTIVVDSVAAASTKVEMEADFDKDGYATTKAIVISKAMRKVTNLISRESICLLFTNQLRQKMGVMFGDPWTTSGGKALAFHSSVRLRLKNLGQIKQKVSGQDQTIGIKTKCQVVKNRMGPPMRHADFDIYFDSGIDDIGSILKVLKNYKLVKSGGAWYTLKIDGKEDIKFQAKDFEEILNRDGMKEYLYELICDKLIMKYKERPNHTIGEDVEYDNEVEG